MTEQSPLELKILQWKVIEPTKEGAAYQFAGTRVEYKGKMYHLYNPGKSETQLKDLQTGTRIIIPLTYEQLVSIYKVQKQSSENKTQ